MGTHPSCPSRLRYHHNNDCDRSDDGKIDSKLSASKTSAIASSSSSSPSTTNNMLLSDYLKHNPEIVGTVPQGYDNNDLPFLFKVLSIKTALSIQVYVRLFVL